MGKRKSKRRSRRQWGGDFLDPSAWKKRYMVVANDMVEQTKNNADEVLKRAPQFLEKLEGDTKNKELI